LGAVLTIGKVATRAGLRASAIRYYEEEGLVPTADRKGGKRVYDESVLDRLALIELAKSAGFTIRETRELLAVFGRRRTAAASWNKLAQAKLAELDEQIARASKMKALLSMLIRCECPALDDCGRALNAGRPTPPPRNPFKPTPKKSRRTDKG
jgi:MerR family redox-sensitive transcriptional activator SoxR